MTGPDVLNAPSGTADGPVPVWEMTPSTSTAVLLGLLIAIAGILTSRVDILLIALPLFASAAISIDRKPHGGAGSAVRIDVTRAARTQGVAEFDYRVSIDAPADVDLVQLRLTVGGSTPRELIVTPHGTGPGANCVTGRVPVMHSGRQRVVAVAHRLVGIDCGWISLPTPIEVYDRVVAPVIVPLPTIPLPHRLRGLTGMHGSVRAGDGGDFRDVHPYASGDRLRRIDWKATARRSQGFGELYVRRTDATSDATIVLVIDSRDDVGERVEEWSRGPGNGGMSSMDLAREAAASLAAAAIGMGDRVGLHDLASPGRVVRPGAGKRHLDRLLQRIEMSEPSAARLNVQRAPIVPAGAIVYLLSTFLDDASMSIALLWRGAGHRVVGVDVLPRVRLEGVDQRMQIAYRVVATERRRRMAVMWATGVEVLRWQEEPDRPRTVTLRVLSRAGRSPR